MEVHPSVHFTDPLCGKPFGPDFVQIILCSLRQKVTTQHTCKSKVTWLCPTEFSNSNHSPLCYEIIQSCRWLPVFWRNLLPPLSWCQNINNHSLHFHCSEIPIAHMDSEMPYNIYFLHLGKARKKLQQAPTFLHLSRQLCTLFYITLNCLMNGTNFVE